MESTVIAWTDSAGAVHVTPLDAADNRRGDDFSAPGQEMHGFATMADGTVYTAGSGTVTLLAATNVVLGELTTTSSALTVTATGFIAYSAVAGAVDFQRKTHRRAAVGAAPRARHA